MASRSREAPRKPQGQRRTVGRRIAPARIESARRRPGNSIGLRRFFLIAVQFEPLPQSFYKPSAEIVAPRLLGHFLIRNTPDGPCGGPIVETEAYLVGDPACHGFIGETPRNASLYGPPGHAYVFLIYSFHYCFNAGCHPQG